MIKQIFNLVLSASQLDASGADKKKVVMDALKQLDIPGYDEEVASMAVDIAVKIYKCEETKKLILETKTCCRKKFFQ